MIRINGIRKYAIITVILFLYTFSTMLFAGNKVIIVIVDGARYSETFGSGPAYIPYIWNQLKPAATVYTRFYNYGVTLTISGHASIASGTWQSLANDGSQLSTEPTVFEYFRKERVAPMTENYVVTGKSKLSMLSYSLKQGYGQGFEASINVADRTDNETYSQLIQIMDDLQPDLIMVNFAEVDVTGHTNNWDGYLESIQNVDNLIYQLWQRIQTDEPANDYKDSTTLIVTNDHGRHDDAHGGFQNHGDSCDGCQHLMLLCIGKNVTAGQVIEEIRDQRDIAPTVGDLIGFNALFTDGTSLFEGDISLPVKLSAFGVGRDLRSGINLQWTTQSELNNLGFNILRSHLFDRNFVAINAELIEGKGNTSYPSHYSYVDKDVNPGFNYYYKLQAISYDGTYHHYGPIEYRADEDYFLPANGPLTLYQNFPNPFNTSTQIRFHLTESSPVTVSIYDNSGRRVSILRHGVIPAGMNLILWEAEGFASGSYYYRVESGNQRHTGRMNLIK